MVMGNNPFKVEQEGFPISFGFALRSELRVEDSGQARFVLVRQIAFRVTGVI
jgi:hypothetical protein